MSLSANARSLRSRHASLTRWANTSSIDASDAARRRDIERFARQVDPDGTLDPAERLVRAERARKAHFALLAFKSAQARRTRKSGGPADDAAA